MKNLPKISKHLRTCKSVSPSNSKRGNCEASMQNEKDMKINKSACTTVLLFDTDNFAKTVWYNKAILFTVAALFFVSLSSAWGQDETDPLALSRTNAGFDAAKSQETLGEHFSGVWRVTHTDDDGQTRSGSAQVASDGSTIDLTLKGPEGDVKYDLVEAEAIRYAEGTGPFKASLTARFKKRSSSAAEQGDLPISEAVRIPIPLDSDKITFEIGDIELHLPIVWSEGNQDRIRVSISTRDNDEKYQGLWTEERGRDLTGGGIATWIRGGVSIKGVLVLEDQLEPSAGANYPFTTDGTPIKQVLTHRTLVIYGTNLPEIADGADIQSQSEFIDYVPVFTTGADRHRKIAEAFEIAGVEQPENSDAFIVKAELNEGILPGDKSLSVDGEVGTWPLIFTSTIDMANECALKDNAGEFKLSVCTAQCTEKFWRWNFFVTNYNVGKTLGLGEHTGIFITGNSYQYDKRFPASMSKIEPTWKIGSPFAAIVEHPGRSESGLDDRVSSYALCAHDVLHRRNIFNHGRTVARNFSDPLLLLAMSGLEGGDPPVDSISTVELGPLEHREWGAPNNPKTKRATSTTACMAKITDGYCDSVCGNCSYVLPEVGGEIPVANNSLTRQNVQFARIEEGGAKRSVVEYVGHIEKKKDSYYTGAAKIANKKATTESLVGGMIPISDPFTHCSVPTAPYSTQAISSPLSHLTGAPQVVTGMYGHNSNTDADAELIQFEACGQNPNVSPDSACETCGRPRKNQQGQNEQWPCLDKTPNTAKAKWALTDGMHNVDDSKLGELPGQFPICANTQERVRGM